MAKRVRLAILRARHDIRAPRIADTACIRMLITSATRRSVLEFWADTTAGYLDFLGSTMFPWVDIDLSDPDPDRTTQFQRAYDATLALDPPEDLRSFDGFVVLTLPGHTEVDNPKAGEPGQPDRIMRGFDGGAGTLADRPACAIPIMAFDHTFMCHEVGHVLGLGHTYGVWNHGADWDQKKPWVEEQVYGDPYDIMSSASFGTRAADPDVVPYRASPTFLGPAVDGWPNPDARSMGPAPALAHLHQWDPLAVPTRSVHRHTGYPTTPRTFRINAARGRTVASQLIAIHPNNEDALGRGRCYLEYRVRAGWDAGLDLSGADLARRAVVAHVLADTSNDGVRCWYRGRIVIPVEIDSDLAIEGTPLHVRVVDADIERGWVEVTVATGSARGIDLVTHGTRTVRGSTDERPMSTPCGDPITWATWITESTMTFHPTTYGYGGSGAPDAAPPTLTWRIGGTPISARSGKVEVTTPDGTFDVTYQHAPTTAELTLASRGGERYEVEVTATAAEGDGSNAMTRSARFVADGWYTGYRDGDLGTLDTCMEKYLRHARLRPEDILVLQDVVPELGRPDWLARVNAKRLEQAIDHLSPAFGAEATALTALNAMRYGRGH